MGTTGTTGFTPGGGRSGHRTHTETGGSGGNWDTLGEPRAAFYDHNTPKGFGYKDTRIMNTQGLVGHAVSTKETTDLSLAYCSNDSIY